MVSKLCFKSAVDAHGCTLAEWAWFETLFQMCFISGSVFRLNVEHRLQSHDVLNSLHTPLGPANWARWTMQRSCNFF